MTDNSEQIANVEADINALKDIFVRAGQLLESAVYKLELLKSGGTAANLKKREDWRGFLDRC